MAIARKQRQQPAETKSVIPEKTIDALINKGGSSTKARPQIQSDNDEQKPIKLLPYTYQLNAIETILNQLPKRGRLSRHAYILHAIDEQIRRDKKKLKLQ